MTRRPLSEALLGAFDGSNTGLGLILGLVAGATVTGMIRVAVPSAAAGMASMSLGELGADNDNGWPEVAAMGAVWLAACAALIATGALIPRPALWAVVTVELAGIGVTITAARDHTIRPRGLSRSLAIIVVTALVAIAAALATKGAS